MVPAYKTGVQRRPAVKFFVNLLVIKSSTSEKPVYMDLASLQGQRITGTVWGYGGGV